MPLVPTVGVLLRLSRSQNGEVHPFSLRGVACLNDCCICCRKENLGINSSFFSEAAILIVITFVARVKTKRIHDQISSLKFHNLFSLSFNNHYV